MSSLKNIEKRKFEKLFAMEGGYVLSFSDRTFAEFFEDLGIDISQEKYFKNGSSKAKRLRAFWELESDFIVGTVLRNLINYGVEMLWIQSDDILINPCNSICDRLHEGTPDLSIFETGSTDNLKSNTKLLLAEISSSFQNGNPEATIDRLHTFTIQFVRKLCDKNGIEVLPNKPLHSLFGEYVKSLTARGLLQSHMSERILKSNISILESFNDVRNNYSLAHDNEVLNKAESKFVFQSIVNTLRFLIDLEQIESI